MGGGLFINVGVSRDEERAHRRAGRSILEGEEEYIYR